MVNGVEVHNLRHLRRLVEDCEESSLRFDLDDGRVVVLDFQAAKEASLRILQRHRISSHTSNDLLQKEHASEDTLECWEAPWQKEDNGADLEEPIKEDKEPIPVNISV